MKIKLMFLFGIITNFLFYLIRFIIDYPIGWLNFGIFEVDMYRDFEIYMNWSIELTPNCPYPFFIYFISIFRFLPFSIEFCCSIPIFISNICIGYQLYKISTYYQLDSDKIIFIFYFNPFTIFYFSMMLLNSCVYVLFILIAFNYLLCSKYLLSLIFGIISCLLKINAIIFLIFLVYIKFGKKITLICILTTFILLTIILFIQINIGILNLIKTRLLHTESYSVSLFPKSVISTILSFICILFLFNYIFNLKTSFLIQFTLLSFIFDMFFQIGLNKYYLYLSIILYISLNSKNNIIYIYSLFLIFRILMHSILVLIIFSIYNYEIKVIKNKYIIS